MANLPAGMPVLEAGAHLDPTDGACLMELTSLLAGERFTDRPHCADPVLAELVRDVNDAISFDGRQRLASTAPYMIGLVGDDRIAPAVVAAVAGVALSRSALPQRSRTRLHRQERRARARLARTQHDAGRRVQIARRLRRRLSAAVYARGPGSRAVTRTVLEMSVVGGAERDRALHEALVAALDAAASATAAPAGRPSRPIPSPPRTACPR